LTDLAFTLCSKDENFKNLKKRDQGEAVVLANPKTIEYQVVRTSLLPGLLKTISSNKHLPLPLKLFEVSDIVLRDEKMERRARNQRNISLLYCGKISGLENIRGAIDRIFQVLNIQQVKKKEESVSTATRKAGFYVDDSSCKDESYFEGRRANIIYDGKCVGSFGVLHPEVLVSFEIGYPCSSLEMNVEPFL